MFSNSPLALRATCRLRTLYEVQRLRARGCLAHVYLPEPWRGLPCMCQVSAAYPSNALRAPRTYYVPTAALISALSAANCLTLSPG